MSSTVSILSVVSGRALKVLAASALLLGALPAAQAAPTAWQATINVVSEGGVGTFGFHGANIGGASVDFPVATATAGVPVTVGSYSVDLTTTGVLTATLIPAGFVLADGWCSDNAGAPGNRVPTVSLVGNTFTVPANTMTNGHSYTCTVKFAATQPATVPTLGEYGLGLLALLTAGAAALGLRRRRA